MSTLHLILPPLARLDRSPALVRWLARGDVRASAPRGRIAALREVFRVPAEAMPVAALLREHTAHDAADHDWLCADPSFVQAEPTGARLLTCGDMELTRAEADALARPLRPLFGDAGAPLEVSTPQRWHLRMPRGTSAPAFTPPDDALGAHLLDHLPQGDEGRRWRRLFNEAQVILHAHPLNAERRERGQLPVNALWFWGGGALPMWVKSSVRMLSSDDPLAQVLAQRAGITVTALAPQALDRLQRDADALFDLGMLDVARIERDWLPRIDASLRRGRIGALELAFVSGERYVFKRRHRWRFWRRGSHSSL